MLMVYMASGVGFPRGHEMNTSAISLKKQDLLNLSTEAGFYK